MRTALLAVACATLTLLVPSSAGSAADDVEVGSLTLHRCDVAPRALCGSIRRDWEPGDPGQGRVKVGFAFVPARDASRPALGTLVPHEGGPGYSTTGSVSYFTGMYAGLLERRNLLLVDQRGTGRSTALDCPDLQDLKIPYNVAAGRCGRSLGDRADDYTTALSADDLAAVVDALDLTGGLDLYGDSYGTFFVQVFAGRHPSLVRSMVVDGAYPTYGETGWYPTQAPAMRSSFGAVCQRSRECRSAGRPWRAVLDAVLDTVRHRPWRGVSHDADGRRMRVTVDAESLAAVAFGATYGPSFYREMTAALRSALRGDRAPILRLVAEATGGGTDAGNPRDYSEGLDAAVACHDYPQVYDMTASPADREREYARALRQRSRERPRTYAPFTVREYAGSDWQMLDWCTRWPVAPAEDPAGPVRPPGGSYPDVPVLVLSGELDSITTPAEGRMITEQFPHATQVVVANSFHVTALGDTDGCASALVRRFVRHPDRVVPTDSCAGVRPVDAMGVFPTRAAELGRRSAVDATVADVIDRWWNNYTGKGVGLRGGTFTYSGDRTIRFRLHGVRLVRDLAVSGTVAWDRYRGRVTTDLTVRGG